MSTNCSGVLLRYSPSPISGERLNFGVLAVDHFSLELAVRFVPRGGRLAKAFNAFDHQQYARVISELRRLVEFGKRVANGTGVLPGLEDYKQAADLMTRIWPDRGTQFTFSRQLVGEADNVDLFADSLFEHFVVNQARKSGARESRTDKQVFQNFAAKLSRPQLMENFSPAIIETSVFRHEFEYTTVHEGIHIIQPLSFDLSDDDGIQEKASRWFGYLYSLQERKDLASINLILAPPKDANSGAFKRARLFLAQSPARPVIVDEQNAVDFESRLVKMVS